MSVPKAPPKASGYDTIFLTIAEVTQSELLTDDSLQHKIALSRGIVSYLLRDMVEG
jgi:predicted nucleic acid-binding protein